MIVRELVLDNGSLGELSLAGTTPRYESAAQGNAATPAWTQDEAIASNVNIRAAGLDLDGSTRLELRYYAAAGEYKFYRDGTLVLTRAAGSPHNLIAGTDVDDGQNHSVFAATIIHGAILLACEVSTDAGVTKGVSLVTLQASDASSTDWFSSGNVTLTTFANLGGGTTYDGTAFGREWAMPDKGFTVPGTDRSLARVVTWTDYRSADGTSNKGGQVFAVGLWRDTTADRWTFGTPALVYDSVTQEGARDGVHWHCAWYSQVSATRGWLGIAVGDGNANNRVLGLDLSVASGELFKQFDSATVDATHNLQGTEGSDAGGVSPIGEYGWQLFSMVEGASAGTFIAGTDETDDGIASFTMPDPDDATPQVQFSRVWGSGFGSERDATTSTHNLHSLTRDEDGRIVGLLAPGPSSPGRTGGVGARVVYSPDGGDTWAAIGLAPTNMVENRPWLVEDGRIRIDRATAGDGLYSCKIPAVVSRQGLLHSPGATSIARYSSSGQWQTSNVGTGNSVTFATVSAGQVTFGAATYDVPAGIPDGFAVAKVVAGETAAFLAIHHPTELTDMVPDGGRAWSVWWARPLGSGAAFRLAIGDGSTWDIANKAYRRLLVQDWSRLVVSGTVSPGAAWRPRVQMLAEQGTALPQEFLLILEQVTVDEPPSDRPPSAINVRGGADVTIDDDQVRTSTFACGSSWSVLLDLRVPTWSWDTSIQGVWGDVLLGVVYGDANEFLTLHAQHNAGSPRIRATVFNAGSSAGTVDVPIDFFHRDDPLVLAVTYTSGALTVYAQVGGAEPDGDPVESASSATLALATQPTQVRFYYATDSARVVARKVWFHPDEALTASDVADAISSQDRLTIRPVPLRGRHVPGRLRRPYNLAGRVL